MYYEVIGRFIDVITGKEVLPGEQFDPGDDARAKRLILARCLKAIPETQTVRVPVLSDSIVLPRRPGRPRKT